MDDIIFFVTGSSVRLSSYAYKRIEYPFSNDYQNLNSSRIKSLNLYPILKKNEFMNCIESLKKLKKLPNEIDEIELYKYSGGSIGFLISEEKSEIKTEMITDELLFTILQIYHSNTYDKEEVDFFNRIFVSSKMLEEELKNIFEKEKSYIDMFDIWCDCGYLLKHEEFSPKYTFLSINILNYVLMKEDQVSALESLGIRYPEGRNVAEIIWEPLIAEGICENKLKIKFQKLIQESIKMTKDKKIDLSNLICNIKSEKKFICKIQNDQFSIDLLVCNLEQNTLYIDHYQVKLGYSYNFLQKKDVSILTNSNVKKRFELLVECLKKIDLDQQEEEEESIEKERNILQVEQKYFIITSKKIGETLLQNLLEIEFEVINLNDEQLSYLPNRVKSFVQTSKIDLFENILKNKILSITSSII